ncbi:MAG: membrane protein insertase YidC, partial [Patescibacteria group bacterium]
MNIFTTLITQPLANGLILFYNLLGHNLGLAILGFSISLIFVMRPLTKPYMDSMKKVKDVQPLVNKLKKKYDKDKLGFSKAQAELYKQKGINPAAGCLPYILQIVILISLFSVFTTVLSADTGAIDKINKLMYAPLKFSDTGQLNTKFLYFDLKKPDTIKVPGLTFALPGLILILA